MADNAGTTQPSTGLISSGDYKISAVMIITSTGQAVDVKNIMLELNLYEDIYSPVMTGDITLGDGADILSSYNMHGNEFICISIDKPSLNKPIIKTFRLYKTSDRSFGTASLQNYTLHFCSEELLLSTQILISKAYKGLTIDKMINDILVNKLQVNPTKMANGIFSTASGNFDIIIPRMQPFEAIQWLSPKAYNNNQNMFFFFENRDGFNFTSYENLISLPVYNTYSRSVKITTNPEENFNSYNFIGIIEDYDIVKATRHGSFSSTLCLLDLVNRSFNSYNFNSTMLSNNAILNTSIPANNLKNRLGQTLYSTQENNLKFMSTTDSDPTFNPAKLQNWVPQYSTRIGQLNMFKAVIAIPGDIFLKVGAVVILNTPKMSTQTEVTQNDPLRSGKYFVSGIHHKFIQDNSTTIIELLSDSISAVLPQAAQSTQTISTVIQA